MIESSRIFAIRSHRAVEFKINPGRSLYCSGDAAVVVCVTTLPDSSSSTPPL